MAPRLALVGRLPWQRADNGRFRLFARGLPLARAARFDRRLGKRFNPAILLDEKNPLRRHLYHLTDQVWFEYGGVQNFQHQAVGRLIVECPGGIEIDYCFENGSALDQALKTSQGVLPRR